MPFASLEERLKRWAGLFEKAEPTVPGAEAARGKQKTAGARRAPTVFLDIIL